MDREMMALSYQWWIKLSPLWKKFARETHLCGYDKEDLVQESFLQLVKCIEKFDESLGIPFESYYKIQLYGWRANQNRKKREMLSISEEGDLQITEKPDPKANIERQMENKLLIQTFLQGLKAMDAAQQLIIIQYYLYNMPLKEIAARLNIKYKAAEFQKGKAIKRLRSLLEEKQKIV